MHYTNLLRNHRSTYDKNVVLDITTAQFKCAAQVSLRGSLVPFFVPDTTFCSKFYKKFVIPIL